MNSPEISAPTPTASTVSTAVKLLRPCEIAEAGGVHPTTVKQIAEQLRMDVLRLTDGSRLFTEDQQAKILAEIERRRQEAMRR